MHDIFCKKMQKINRKSLTMLFLDVTIVIRPQFGKVAKMLFS